MSRRDLWIGGVAFAIYLMLGATWAATTPLYGVPDEAEHIKRAAMILEGTLVGERRVVEYEGGATAAQFVEDLPRPYYEMGFGHTCFAFARSTADCTQPLTDDGTLVPTETTAGAYQPLFYGIVAPSLAVGSPTEGYFAARMTSAVAFAALIGAAAACMSSLAGSLGVAGLVLAVTPMAVFLGGSVNPNGLEIAAAAAVWAGFSALLRRPGRTTAAITAIAAVLFAWSRPLSPLLLPCILAVCVIAYGWRDTLSVVRRCRPVQVVLGLAALAAVTSAGWLIAFDSFSSFIAHPSPDLVGLSAAQASFEESPLRFEQMVGVLGWIDVRLPTPVYLTYYAAVLAMLGTALVRGTPRGRWAVLSVAVAAVMMPILVETREAADLGLFWHGRYTLPVAVGVPVLAPLVMADRTIATGGRSRSLRHLAVVLATVAGATHVVAHMFSMARYSTGLQGGLELTAHPWSYLSAPGWSPPGPDPMYLLLVVLAAVGLPALTLAADRALPGGAGVRQGVGQDG